jgi:hypothetical protein
MINVLLVSKDSQNFRNLLKIGNTRFMLVL